MYLEKGSQFRVEAIFIAHRKGLPMQEVKRIEAIKGVGLEGDRYAKKVGAYSGVRIPDLDRQVSLISSQAINEANQILESWGALTFSFAETRRNLVLEIYPDLLNNLVGKVFRIGDVELQGSELCEPCRRPTALLKRPDGAKFERAFEGRGGLRARIISGGEISINSLVLV